ncbi:MAG TPA: LysE family translocator [Solirubrobacteraceae bacterium]
MLPTAHLLEFVVAVYVLILIPGPSVLFVVSRGVALGRRAAMATVMGNTLGLLLQLLVVCIGLGTLLARSDALFTVVKLIGAGYLMLLGVRAIRQRKELAGALNPLVIEPRRTRRIVREGFTVGATNPKGVLMFTALVPQFIEPARGHTTLQLATLGLICVLIGLLSDSSWAMASGTARQWLGRSPRRLERMSTAGGVTMIGVGAVLALSGRRG